MNNVKIVGMLGNLYVGELKDKTLVYSSDRLSWFKDKRRLLELLATIKPATKVA